MKIAVYVASAVSAFCFASHAYAGAPSWCSGLGNTEVDRAGDLKDALGDGTPPDPDRPQQVTDPRAALFSIVVKMCRPDEESAGSQRQLEAARKKWSVRLDLADEDWVDVGAWAGQSISERNWNEVKPDRDLDTRPWSSFDAIDQWVWLTRNGNQSLAIDHHYLADAFGPKLTEVGRLGYIRNCVNADKDAAVMWAMCQGDIDQLDLKKLAGELRSNTRYPKWERHRIRLSLYALKIRLARHAEKIKKLIAEDPGYAKLFEVAAAARKEFDTHYKTDAELIEVVSQMEDARITNKRSAFAGCEDKIWPMWKAAVATIPAKTFETDHDKYGDLVARPILGIPTGYLASVALVTCMTGNDAKGEVNALGRVLRKGISSWPGFRGPRTAVESAVATAGIVFDARDATLSYPQVNRSFGTIDKSVGRATGVIAKLKPAGDTVSVEFKQEKVTETRCDNFKTTNRIIQFRVDGSPIYDTICTKNKTVTFNSADAPQTVNARYAAGVKPGMFTIIEGDVISGVWAKSTSTTPMFVFGVPVK
jgi:hypothetical protein